LSERRLYYATGDFRSSAINGRPAKEVIREVIGAFECASPVDGCVYLSGELTTGRRFYELLRRHGARSKQELKRRLGDAYERAWRDLMEENLAHGRTFFHKMHSDGHRNLINPGPFYARGWEQEHYLYLWEWVIVHSCREVRFNSGWNYSSGCTLEYAIGLRKGIPRLHPDGGPLDAPEAVAEMEAALRDLDSSGIDAPDLRVNLQRVQDAARG
jgi:hypothetical protein